MGNDKVRTDYMPTEEFRRREREQRRRGYEPIGPQSIPLQVDFDANYDRFVASVAHGIRHHVVYRRDGGVFARGLVRSSDELKEIHDNLKKNAAHRAGKVRLDARLYRRKASVPSLQWAMYVVFESKDVIDEDEGEFITASYDVTYESEKKFAEDVVETADMITGNPAWNPPNKWGADRVLRLRDWVGLAKRVGYPRVLKLWYYNRRAVFLYTRFETTATQRKSMTAQTGGKLPFDGSTGNFGSYAPWRNYPFRQAVEECRRYRSVDDCADHIGDVLRHAESEIFESIREMNAAVQRLSPLASANPWQGMKGAASDATGPEVNAFLKHIGTLLRDPDSFYRPYTRYTQSYQTLWQKF
jgi:hypothetical protein